MDRKFAALTDIADELGLDWRRLPIDTEEHLLHGYVVLAQWINCRKKGRRHWLDPLE